MRPLHNFIKSGVTLSLLACTTLVHADSWEQQVSLPLTIQYESNPALSATDEQSVRKTIFTPHYTAITSDGINEWNADISLRVERSSDTTLSSDREDPSLNLGWTRTLEKGQFGVTAHLDKRSTRESEFDDSGQVFVDGTRKSQSVSANWSHELSEQLSLSINAKHDRTTYSNTSLTDLATRSLTTKLGYQQSERLEPFVQLSSSKTRYDSNQTDSTITSLELGTSWQATEDLDFVASIGGNRVSAASNSSGEQASIAMNYQTEQTQSNITLSRATTPSGATGGVIEANQLKGRWGYSLNETSSLGLDFNLHENLDLNKNKTTSLSANYTKELSESWRLNLSAQHRKRDDTVTKADNNILGLTLIYNASYK